MGAIKDTYQQLVYRLTPDGLGPFWWASKDSNNDVYQIGYFDSLTGTVESTANLFAFDTFLGILQGLNNNNITISQVEFNINVEEINDAFALNQQFNLNSAQLNGIAAAFDQELLCMKLGAYQLVRRFYLNGNFTLLQLRGVLLYLGQNNKVTKTKVFNDLAVLVNNGDITQQQLDNFESDWDLLVGTDL